MATMPKQVAPTPGLPPAVAAAARALGCSELRLAVLNALATAPAGPRALAAGLDVAETTVSDHLKALADAEVIVPVDPTARRRGPNPPFAWRLDHERFAELLTTLTTYLPRRPEAPRRTTRQAQPPRT